MKTNIIKLKKCIKWASVGLVIAGLILGGVGVLCGGINTINFLFWL